MSKHNRTTATSSLELNTGAPFVVGRSNDCDLTVPSQRISRRHAEIHGGGEDTFVLKDLGSQNGTLVNGKRIRGEHTLVDGDDTSTATLKRKVEPFIERVGELEKEFDHVITRLGLESVAGEVA